MTTANLRLLAVLSVLLLAVAACGGGEQPRTDRSTTTDVGAPSMPATTGDPTTTIAFGTTTVPLSVPVPIDDTDMAESSADADRAPSTTEAAELDGSDDAPDSAGAQPIVGMYVPYWDVEAARQAVVDGTDVITDVSMFAYRIRADGGVELHDPVGGQVDFGWVRELRSEGKRVFATITNDLPAPERWSSAVVHQVVSDPEVVERHVDELVKLTEDGGFDGIEIDYEALDPADRSAYAAFLSQLGQALHQRGRLLAVDIQAFDTGFDTDVYDRASIAASVDQFRLMTYTYSWETSPAGPIAPLPWVEQVADAVLTTTPPDKILLGIAGFGIDWTSDGDGVSLTWDQAQELLGPDQRRWAEPDAEWTGTYDDHQVWFSDAETARRRAELVTPRDLAGVFVWGAPNADPDFWTGIQEGLSG